MQRLLQEHYHRYINRLSHTLLACPTMQNRDTRNVLLGDMPERIRNHLNINLPWPLLTVQNLIETCANYKEGETELFRLLNQYELDSLSFQAVQKEWQTIKQEIAEQDRLINWVRESCVPWADMRQMFVAVTPQDYAVYPVSVEALVNDLWEVPAGHWPLLAFMGRLQKRPELPENVQHSLHDWCAEAPHSNVLKLPGDGVERFDRDNETRIIVAIEPGKQDTSKRLVSLWVSDGGELSMLREFQVEANRLEQAVSEEIDTWTVAYGLTEVIEFYLPKMLLTMPVDAWQMRAGSLQQRFIERYRVIKGILERQEARALRIQLERTTLPDEKRRLVLAVRNNPLIWELVRRSKDWETRWQELNHVGGRQFSELAQSIAIGDPCPPVEAKPFALLTFTPHDLASMELDDPIGQLMIAGIPLIAWVRTVAESSETAAHLHHHLFDAHCACTIHVANDLVNLMHKVCRQTPDAADSYQIGQNLNLIVDNPESKLPHIGRVMM